MKNYEKNVLKDRFEVLKISRITYLIECRFGFFLQVFTLYLRLSINSAIFGLSVDFHSCCKFVADTLIAALIKFYF